MRNFIWSCFQVTGSIEAYLLYKDLEQVVEQKWNYPTEDQDEEETV